MSHERPTASRCQACLVAARTDGLDSAALAASPRTVVRACLCTWAVLADALPALQAARRRPDSFDQALLPLQPLVEAIAAVETVAFARIEGADRRALAVQWLDARHRAMGEAAALPELVSGMACTTACCLAGEAHIGTPAQDLVVSAAATLAA